MLKVVIFLLFLLMLISLGFGFYFLVKDGSDEPQHRLLTSLKLRIVIAVLLVGCLLFGFYTGTLVNQAPW